MFDKRLVRHTVTMHIHINVSSQSIFLVWKRNCGYCVRRRNCRTWSQNSSVEAEIRNVKLQYISCVEAELRNLKSQDIPNAEAELRHRGT